MVIENVSPEVDGGRFAIKRVIGDEVKVEAYVFADGHDVLSAVLQYRHQTAEEWAEAEMTPGIEDKWTGVFTVDQTGSYFYRLEAWVDEFETRRRDMAKKLAEGQDVQLVSGSPWLEAAKEAESKSVGDRAFATRYDRELRVEVDRPLARFSAWYEMFPRSASGQAGAYGTFKDVERGLPRIAEMGFDILYLPPIHPIGRSFRKGKNGKLTPDPDDPGSPWAIGSPAGGHKAVQSELGTLEDFRSLVGRARELNMEIALDIAFQCSPDHPYVKEHPDWFRRRPDGSIQYAENPPRKYQDIYPFDFQSADWKALWQELKSIFEFWIGEGVCVFRVDNPHTKPLPFWEWCISELKEAHPGTLFLGEAFTRRKVMYYLAKLGFTQSYNYFPWRNTRHELTEYLTELTKTPVREYFRPSLWPNTPDILTQYLQFGGRPAFMARLILAATLGASYGIYGPAFELCMNQPREPGSEEYLDSEKYEIPQWNLKAASSLRDLIARVNEIRRDNPALQSDWSLEFHEVDNEQLIAYSKRAQENLVIMVVNLDPHHTHSGWLRLPLENWGISPRDTFQVHDLLTDRRHLWTGERNYVELNPRFVPAHIFRLRRYARTERDFDYFI